MDQIYWEHENVTLLKRLQKQMVVGVRSDESDLQCAFNDGKNFGGTGMSVRRVHAVGGIVEPSNGGAQGVEAGQGHHVDQGHVECDPVGSACGLGEPGEEGITTHFRTALLLSTLITPFLFLILVYFLFYRFRLKWVRVQTQKRSPEEGGFGSDELGPDHHKELIGFASGEELTVQEILDAPGEVVGKSSCGTLYRAEFGDNESSLILLRFVSPACDGRRQEVVETVRGVVGPVRHSNLVPMIVLYLGPRGETLFVHPFMRETEGRENGVGRREAAAGGAGRSKEREREAGSGSGSGSGSGRGREARGSGVAA